MHPFAKGFIASYFGFVIVFGVAASLAMLLNIGYVVGGSKRDFLLTPIVMLLWMAGLVKFGRWLSQRNEDYIIHFLKSTLGAEEYYRS